MKLIKKIVALGLVMGASILCVNAQRTFESEQRKAEQQQAQEQPKQDDLVVGLNKVFWGGGITAGYGGSGSGAALNLGINPEVGYTVFKPLDIGMAANFLYTNYKNSATQETLNKYNYGLGAFARIHVMDQFFLQGLVEHNWINYKLRDNVGNSYTQNLTSVNALVGVGYGQRIVGQNGFYSVIMLDISKDKNSPYISNGVAYPVFRAGYIFYLNRKK